MHDNGRAGATRVNASLRVLDHFMCSFSGSTAAAYGGDARDFARWCEWAGVGLLECTRCDVEAYLMHLRDIHQLAPSTVARRLTVIRAFAAYAVDEGVLGHSPAERIRRPRLAVRETCRGLTAEEAALLLDAATRVRDRRVEPLVTMLLLTGVRVSEALSVAIEDVLVRTGRLTIRVQRKNAKLSVVPVCDELARSLNAYVGARRSGPLFPGHKGAPWSRTSAWRAIRALGEASLPPGHASVSPHDLRHAFATIALDAGAALRDVQDAMAHSDPRTTRVYDHARNALDRHPTRLVANSVLGPRRVPR